MKQLSEIEELDLSCIDMWSFEMKKVIWIAKSCDFIVAVGYTGAP